MVESQDEEQGQHAEGRQADMTSIHDSLPRGRRRWCESRLLLGADGQLVEQGRVCSWCDRHPRLPRGDKYMQLVGLIFKQREYNNCGASYRV